MNQVQCEEQYQNFTNITGYCKPEFDKYNICWAPVLTDTNVSVKCPRHKALNYRLYTIRYCDKDGNWNKSTWEWNCFYPSVQSLLSTMERLGPDAYIVIDKTRIVEIVGTILSFFALVLSLLIFYKYSVLRNNRTTIHKNLFIATLLQVCIRLIMYTDQALGNNLDNVDGLCECFVTLLEFSKIASVMWMFIEGLYLHNAITFTVFQEHSYIKVYCYVGWLVPFVLTLIWVISMILIDTDICWFLYNLSGNYWLLEGPSTFLIVVNFFFLLNIIRILVMKLRESRISEIQQIRKAVRAALFLLPLMGINNILFVINYRNLTDLTTFAIWAYTSNFFSTFQGFFMATLYCFLNGEVKEAIKTKFFCYKFLMSKTSTFRKHSTEVTGLTGVDSDP